MLLPINIIKTTVPTVKKHAQIPYIQKGALANNDTKKDFISIYGNSDLNFRGYANINETSNEEFQKTIEENYFHLPKITKPDGSTIQIMPDENQKRCARKLFEGKNLLFATGTGNGKTAVAHYIMTKNLKEGKKSVYTVPIKALANDKYREFSEIYGKNNVGLLTGEIKLNPDAPIVIMVTEIYDKQMASCANNSEIATVVYDEAHYISDEERGCAWENSIINSTKKGVQTLFLSATIGNSADFCNWTQNLNPDIKTDRIDMGFKDRNVPLVWYLFKNNDFTTISDNRENNPKIRKIHTPRVKDNFDVLVQKMNEKDMLPAIIFKQSQKGCDYIIESLLDSNINLTNEKEKEEIKETIKRYEREYCFLNLNEEALKRGYAAHHAGKLPQERKLVEELFSKKLIKAIAATTTLSAGINMPAKTTVICSMTHGEYNPTTKETQSVPLSTNEFHQMAGRAGRRGIDIIGNIVLYNLGTPKNGFRTTKAQKDKNNDKIDELDLAYNLLSSNPDNLRSQFRPQPSMLAQYFENNSDLNNLRGLINQSFKVHLSQDKEKCANDLMKKFQNLSIVLLKQGFVIKNNRGEFFLTPKGYILEMSQGANPLLLASLLYDEKLRDMTPLELCQIAGYLANPDDIGSSEPESKFLPSLFSEKIISLTKSKENCKNYRAIEDMYLKSEASITKSLLEGRIPLTDIKKKNSFSGYISYLWAFYNKKYSQDDGNHNFLKLMQETLEAPQRASEELKKEFSKKASEGNAYMSIAQTVSVLEQMKRISEFALNREDLFYDTQYWQELRENLQTAIDLVKTEPFKTEETINK